MLKGSCLCGAVRYEIHGKLSGVLNCHCSMCRRAQGSAFRTRTRVSALDDEPGVKPKFHVFVGSKAPWYEITDSLPQFEALPP